MTHQLDTEKLAREAGFDLRNDGVRDDGYPSHYFDCWPEQLKMFAALVLEEAAKCVEQTPSFKWVDGIDQWDKACPAKVMSSPKDYAAAIRALAAGVR